MEKRKPNDLPPEQCLAVDTDTLCKLLCCGRHTAVQIGDLANARITMNTRVYYNGHLHPYHTREYAGEGKKH